MALELMKYINERLNRIEQRLTLARPKRCVIIYPGGADDESGGEWERSYRPDYQPPLTSVAEAEARYPGENLVIIKVISEQQPFKGPGN